MGIEKRDLTSAREVDDSLGLSCHYALDYLQVCKKCVFVAN